MKRPPFRALGASLLAMLVLGGCNESESITPVPESTPPEPSVRALVHGAVTSPVFDALREQVEMTESDGGQDPSDFDMLIMDGDAFTAQQLHDDELVARALQNGVWILALDASEDDKQEGMGYLSHAASGGQSLAYAKHIGRDTNGRHQVQVVELPTPGEVTKIRGDEANASSATVTAQGVDARVASLTDALLENITSPRLEPLQENGPSNIPADLIYATYNFSQVYPWKTDFSYRHPNTTGLQHPSLQVNTILTVLLSNKGNPQGNFQFVVADVDITANPKSSASEPFANMYGRDAGIWTAWGYDEMGWFQDRIVTDLVPGPQSRDWALVASSPETENGETELTTGIEFSIGFEGKEPTADFTYSSETTRSIKDWKVTEKSEEGGQNQAAWDYRTAYPVDADATYDCDQEIYGTGCWLALPPNDLSMNTMHLHTKAAWRTPGIVNGWAVIKSISEHSMADLFCDQDGGLRCWHTNSHSSVLTQGVDLKINMAAVIPIAIDSISFSPDPATAGDKVMGTVTLEKPAQVDTEIQLASNSQNATVKPKVTVKQGDTSADFEILTSANGIPAGGSTVATISAFYADDFQAQLTINN